MSIELTIGQRVFNNGDMANVEHWGTIVEKKPGQVKIQPDKDSDRTDAYWVHECSFSKKYLGNGLSRFVTKAAYDEWKADRMKEFEHAMAEIMSRKEERLVS